MRSSHLTPDDLQKRLKAVCIAVTHEASDPRLIKSEVLKYLKVINSAAQISTELNAIIQRVGFEGVKNDIFRFVAIAIKRIEEVRKAFEERGNGSSTVETDGA